MKIRSAESFFVLTEQYAVLLLPILVSRSPAEMKVRMMESLEPPPDPEVEEPWSVEAERRWQEIESDAVQTIAWEEVRARLFRRG